MCHGKVTCSPIVSGSLFQVLFLFVYSPSSSVTWSIHFTVLGVWQYCRNFFSACVQASSMFFFLAVSSRLQVGFPLMQLMRMHEVIFSEMWRIVENQGQAG